jgi:hypothetical protein
MRAVVRLFPGLSIAAFVALMVAAPLHAQVTTATLLGSIRDSSGATSRARPFSRRIRGPVCRGKPSATSVESSS